MDKSETRLPRIERRLVHVLFADLVGFTSLAEELDAEEIALVQDEYFACVRQAVGATGGRVEKYIGDAVLAVFGLPTLRDGDAVRAVDAGLATIENLRRIAPTLGLPPESLQVRVGIHTGEVVVHWFDDDGWRVTGDVVNTASRLQANADPGSVLVGSETALAAGREFVIAPVRDLSLKGKSRQVEAWRVTGRIGPNGSGGGLASGSTLIGRESELERLADTRRGGVRTVVVLAPPGTGKTRLLEEFGARARRDGSSALAVTLSAGATAASVVSDLLQAAIGVRAEDISMVGLVEGLAERGLTGPRDTLAAEHVCATLSGTIAPTPPHELWASWTAVLDAYTGTGTPVWLLDDAHLAGPDLRGFLRHAQLQPHRARRMIVLAARPTALTNGGEEPFGSAETVDLAPLAQGDVTRLIEATVGTHVLGQELVDGIVDASGGNPLFVQELLRTWTQRGALRTSPDRGWTFHDPGPLRLPTTVQAIYLGELDLLPRSARATVQRGSVAGRTFPGRVLPRFGVDDSQAALRYLTGSGLVVGPHETPMIGPDSYDFRHMLLRDAAYATLPRAQRCQLHHVLALWYSEREIPPAERVGTHLELALKEAPRLGVSDDLIDRAEVAAQAASWLERAGDERLAAEPLTAAELFARSLALTADGTDDAARRQLRRAEALRRSGLLEEALAAYARVRPSPGPNAASLLTQAALGFEFALFASRLPREAWRAESQELTNAALEALPTDELVVRSRLLAARARAGAYSGDLDAASADAASALIDARASDDNGAIAFALLSQRALFDGPEHLATRLRDGLELIEAAHAAGETEMEFDGTRLRFIDLIEQGDLQAADAARRDAERLARALGQPQHLWYRPMWHGMRAVLAADPRAEDLIESFRVAGLRWHYRDAAVVHAVQLAQLRCDQGRPDDALPVIEAVTGYSRLIAMRVVILCRTGRVDEAIREIAPLRDENLVGTDRLRSFVLSLVAEAADATGDRELGAVAADALHAWRHQFVVIGSGALCVGSAAHFLGLASRAAGELSPAITWLQRAAEANSVAGVGPPAVRSFAELGRTLIKTGRAGEGRRAIERAGDLAHKFRMSTWLEQFLDSLAAEMAK